MNTAISPVIFIAGGTGSIGKAIAAHAIELGWAVIIHGRSEETVGAVKQSLQDHYSDARLHGVVADIRSNGAIKGLVEAAANIHGRIDAVVDCLVTGPQAGGITGPFEQTNPNAYLELLQLSIVYLEQLTFAALPWLKASGGCLVAFASDAGIYSAPRQALIGAARSATIGFIRNLSAEVARDGVRAHCVSPSFVLETDAADGLAQTAPDRLEKARQRAGLGLPTPQDIAPLVMFLCGEHAKRITGQVISVNGGLNT